MLNGKIQRNNLVEADNQRSINLLHNLTCLDYHHSLVQRLAAKTTTTTTKKEILVIET